MKRVAVIGGAGYVGSALVPRLVKRGYDVTVIDLFLYGRDVFGGCADRIRAVHGDIRDAAMLRRELDGAEAVIHLACVSNDPSFDLDPELGRSINYDAFFGLMEAARVNGVRRFIYASSSSVYGVRPEPDVTEQSPCEPLTDYSRYKLLCERALADSGLPYVIARPATVCGYAPRLRLDVVVNALTISALARKRIVVQGGDQLRPNIHIQAMVEVYRLLLQAPDETVLGQTFNAGHENHGVAELARLVVEEVGDPAVTLSIEPTNDPRSYHINSDKIRRQVGFVPLYDVRDGIRSICQAYREGRIPDALENPRYYNVRMLQTVRLS